MLLEDFIKTKVEILKSADCVQFLGGGRIEEDIRNNNSFCLVLSGIEDDGCVTFCDGNQINILKKTSGFILVENSATKRKVWLTPKEFKIAVF